MDPEDRVPRIQEPVIRIKPEYYLNLAQESQKNGKTNDAIHQYIQYIQNLENPNEIKLIEQVNLTKLILNNCNEPSSNLLNGNMVCFLSVLNIYPENALLWNALGVLVFSQGEYAIAQNYFKKAADAGYLPGEKNFLHVIWHLIPRWHFRMLNDKKRNEAYRKAIHKAIQKGYRNVFDIGTGCGLLSLIAAKTDENVTVVAFEENKTLCDIASNIFERNNVSKQINLTNINSNSTNKPPSPCNLIVTEIFDAGVFGEDCLKSIKHAINNFVSPNKFRIIPSSVTIFVTGLQSLEVTKGVRYTGSLPDLGLINRCLRDVDPEPYDSEYLKNLNVKYMSETKEFLNVNFYDCEQLRKLESDDGCISEIELTCIETGTIHALAVWFDLCLDDEIKISTHPDNADNTCWEQAIYHLEHPVNVEVGTLLKLQPKIEDGRITFEILSPITNCLTCFPLSSELISFLNDSKLVNTIKQAADNFDNCNIVIVDFNIFPLFGFLMAKKGATVYHVYKDECDLLLFNYLMKMNDLSTNRIIFIPEKAIEKYMFYLEPPNILFRNLIKTDGSWNPEEFTLETESKWSCDTLPRKVFLNAQMISSEYLNFCNKVDDSNVFDFKIFSEINKYTGSEHPNLDILEHEKLSTVVSFDISDLDTIDFHMEGKIIKDGDCNGILYWFEMQFSDDETNRFSTLDSTYYDKCCTLLNNSKSVKTEESVMFNILRYEGHLKVYCD